MTALAEGHVAWPLHVGAQAVAETIGNTRLFAA